MRSREPPGHVTHEADVIGDRAHFAQLDNAQQIVVGHANLPTVTTGWVTTATAVAAVLEGV